MLEYKALWHDRIVQKVSKFYPLSQICNCCGFSNPLVKDLKLREWSCPNCGKHNLRDVNASLNILSEGLKILTATVGIPEALNACEELVRPEAIQAQIVEAPNRVTSSHARFKNESMFIELSSKVPI